MIAPLLAHREASALLATRPKAVELFAGVGGMELGLEQAGFHVSVGVELEEIHGRFAQYNFPGTTVLYGNRDGDVRYFDRSVFESVTPAHGELALVAGGPPCQGFSLAGMKLKDDPLNDLVLEFARVVCDLTPLAFLMENVPGITRGNSPHLAEALARLEKVYIVTEPTSLWAADFGIPQLRERIFVLGVRKDLGIEPSFPSPTHVRPSGSQLPLALQPLTPTVWDAIGDLPSVDNYPQLIDGDRIPYDKEPHSDYALAMRGRARDDDDLSLPVIWDQTICTNVRRTQHGPDLSARFASLGFGQMDRLSGLRRLDPAGLSTTIRAGTTKERGAWSAPRPVHPYENRVLTTRECARIQSFPDWFTFHPTKWHGNRQVGNAVPPMLARTVAKHIFELLGLKRPVERLPALQRNDVLIIDDIEDAASSGLSKRTVSQKVIHPRHYSIPAQTRGYPEMNGVNKRPIEFYGEIATSPITPKLQAAVLAQQCPFTSTRCAKTRKGDANQTIGTCTVGFQGVPLIICPKRFLQAHRIFLDCIRFLPRNGRYFVVPEVQVPGGHVDYLLVCRNESGQIADYVGIEIQALDTTGTGGLWDARVDVVNGNLNDGYNFGINWKMSAKTILVQMAHKAPTFEALGKKLVLVVQSEFLSYIRREFKSGHLRTADATDTVHIHAYDNVFLGNELSIVINSTLSTSAKGVELMLGLGKEQAVDDEVMIEGIESRWDKAFELHPTQ